MGDWITEGSADRSFTRPDPIVHLVLRVDADWAMWCSGGAGRPGAWPDARLCRRCRELACDALQAGTVNELDVARWV
jgi:hypothetical protein